ncbi:MAG: class I SAM-dependent methyltransferase [Sneathiella sp.]
MGYNQAYDKLCHFDATYRSKEAEVSSGRVLDVGAGTGALSLSFLRHNDDCNRVELLDPSRVMLEFSRENFTDFDASVDLIEGGIGDQRIRPKTYDTVLCAHVIEHTDDPKESLCWMMSCLKPGGTVLLAVSKPHWCTSLIRWKWGHKAYEPDQLVAMLNDVGFEQVEAVSFRYGPPSRMSYGYRARRI